MAIRFPAPLQAGDRIGVTSPSSGVDEHLWARLEYAVTWLQASGYEVVVGECMDGVRHISAPARDNGTGGWVRLDSAVATWTSRAG
jgi:muramoyltetrapeptide carboxypeptidase LdcA involved in peptidoglycan recycling